MNRMLAAAVFALLIVPIARAQTTNPIRYTWIATSCSTWNCAAGALVLAGGDKYVIALPTGQEERPWVILRRVEAGSVYIPDDEPFHCEVYDDMNVATTSYNALDTCHGAMLLSVPDGKAVLTSLQKCGSLKRRAVR